MNDRRVSLLGRSVPRRVAALGGVVGPAAFVGAWTAGAVIAGGDYSSIDDAISRLAALRADSRPLMTAGFVVFGVAVPVYSCALRLAVGGRSWMAAAGAGAATLAVAATPLGRSPTIDSWHAAFATIGYVALAATPLIAARPLWRQGQHRLAGAGVVAGAVSAASLLLSTTRLPTGLFQRIGLTTADLWIVASASWMAAGSIGHRSG